MYTLLDTHCDTMSELLDCGETLKKNKRMINVEMMNEYRSYVQFYAAYVNKKHKNPMLRCVEILDKAKHEISENNIDLILNSTDLKNTIDSGRIGAILSIEDARALCGSISAVRFFYDYGVRAITLAWNDDNEVTDGADSEKNTGLTTFGKEVVKEMNRLNMIVDVSHITEKGFYDVLETSKSPVMASHSNCYSVCCHRRNLKDEQISSLIKNNGIMCINIYPPFLSENGDATTDDIIRHIDYALSLGAEDNLGLGSDFDGIEKTPQDLKNLQEYENLFEKMVNAGYKMELIDKITHKNVVEFMTRVEN